MICQKCGAQCPEGELFCQNCGSELFSSMNESQGNDSPDDELNSPEIKKKKISFSKNPFRKDSPEKSSEDVSPAPDEDRSSPAGEPKKEPGDNNKISSGNNNKKRTAANRKESRRKIKIALRIAGIVIVIILAAVLIVSIVSHIKANEGKRLSEKIPIGRNIDYCIKETGVDFSNTENPFNIKAVSRFDYMNCSEKAVNIDGIEMPEWAVMVGVDRDKSISSVEYYDFKVLKKGWKGEYSKILFTQDTVSYGMDKKSVSKVMGFDPYYIKRTSRDRTTWCYRYYITDNNTGTDRIFNYYVVFSDTNDTVINAYDSEIEYVNYVLGVNPQD